MNIIKYNTPKDGQQSQYGNGYVGGLYATAGGTGGYLAETRNIWGQPFNGTQDISGSLYNVQNIYATGDLSLTGQQDGDDTTVSGGSIHATGHVEADSYVLSKSYMRAVKFYGDIEGDTAVFNVANVDQGNIENVQGTSLQYDEGSIQDLMSQIINADEITTEYLTVTKSAHFFELIIDKIKAAGGSVIFSPADGFEVLKVAEESDSWKLYWLADDGTKKVDNMWEAGDQALCRSFNVSEGTSYNVSNKYYWALVVDTGTQDFDGVTYNYIEISKTDVDGVLAPEVGDSIAMLGNRNTASRQNAIYIAATKSLDTTLQAPLLCHYRGINDFNLSTHKYTWFAANGNTIRGDLRLETGMTVQDYVDSFGSTGDVHTHYAYANSADGSVKFSKTPYADYGYLGAAVTGSASDAALTYQDYTWVPVSNRRLKYEYSDDAFIRTWQSGTGGMFGSGVNVELHIPERGMSYNAQVRVDVVNTDETVTSPDAFTFLVRREYTGPDSYTETVTPETYATGTPGVFRVDHAYSPYQRYSCEVTYDVDAPVLRLVQDSTWNEYDYYVKPFGKFWFTSNGYSIAGSERFFWFGSREADGNVYELVGDPVDWQTATRNGHVGILVRANSSTPASGTTRVWYTLSGEQRYADLTWEEAENYDVYLTEEPESYKLIPITEIAEIDVKGALKANLSYKVLHTVGNVAETTTSGQFKLWLRRRYNAYSALDSNPVVTDSSISWTETVADYRAMSNQLLGYYVYLLKYEATNANSPLEVRYVPVHMAPGATLEIDDSIRTWVQGNVDDLTDSYTSLEQTFDSFTATVSESVGGLEQSVAELQLTADGLTSSVARINSKNLLGEDQYFDVLTNATYGDGVYAFTESGSLEHTGVSTGVGDCTLSFYATRESTDTSIKVSLYTSTRLVRPVTQVQPLSGGLTVENGVLVELWTTFTPTVLLNSSSEEYFGRRTYLDFSTGEPGSSSGWYLKVEMTGAGTASEFLLVPDNATSSLISQTAEEILLQVGNTSIEIVPTEIVLNGNTRVEGSVAINNGGFSLNGPDGVTMISPDGVGTYSRFTASTSSSQSFYGSGSTAGGSSGTWSGTVTVSASLGSYPTGTALSFPQFAAAGSWWHDNRGTSTSWNISKAVVEIYDGTTRLANTTINVSPAQSAITRSNIFSGVTATGNALTLKVQLTGSFSTTPWSSGAPSIIEGAVSIRVQQPLASSLGLLGYNGYCSNFGDYKNVFLGPEGAFFRYGEHNGLRITPSGLQKYCGTTVSGLMTTGEVADTATSKYASEWMNLTSRTTRIVGGTGSTYLQTNDEVIRFTAAATLYLPYPYNAVGRQVTVANETSSAVTVNTKSGTVSVPASTCYQFVSSGNKWYHVALTQ